MVLRGSVLGSRRGLEASARPAIGRFVSERGAVVVDPAGRAFVEVTRGGRVIADLNLNEGTVGKIAVHAGIAKANPDVKKRDTAMVSDWLAASKAAERRPAAATAKSTAKKSTAKKATTAKKRVAAAASA